MSPPPHATPKSRSEGGGMGSPPAGCPWGGRGHRGAHGPCVSSAGGSGRAGGSGAKAAMAELQRLRQRDIPAGRQLLRDHHGNLLRVADYCESRYLQVRARGRRGRRGRAAALGLGAMLGAAGSPAGTGVLGGDSAHGDGSLSIPVHVPPSTACCCLSLGFFSCHSFPSCCSAAFLLSSWVGLG